MTFFFYGSNSFALRAQIAQMVDAFVTKTGSDIGLERIDGTTAKPEHIRGALQAAPFLSSSRLVIITGLSGAKATYEKLGDPLALVPASTVAVFADPDADKRTSAYKRLLEADKVIHFEALTEGQLALWVKREIERLGGSCGRGVAQELIRRAGDDQIQISHEIAKLVAYSPEVDTETVALLVPPSPEQTIFDLVEAMAAGRTAVALAAYRSVIDGNKDEYYVLTMVQWQLRNLLFAANAPAGMSSADLAKAAGISPYVAGKAGGPARRIGSDRLAKMMIRAVDTEYAIKTGARPAETAVEALVYEISAASETKA